MSSANKKRDGRKFCSICGDFYEDDEKISTFSVRKEWLELTQIKALNKSLTAPTARICSRHFEDEDILKGRIIQDKFYPYLKWTLVKHAIPKLLLGKQLEIFFSIII
jgi:hypothetical protein